MNPNQVDNRNHSSRTQEEGSKATKDEDTSKDKEVNILGKNKYKKAIGAERSGTALQKRVRALAESRNTKVGPPNVARGDKEDTKKTAKKGLKGNGEF